MPKLEGKPTKEERGKDKARIHKKFGTLHNKARRKRMKKLGLWRVAVGRCKRIFRVFP